MLTNAEVWGGSALAGLLSSVVHTVNDVILISEAEPIDVAQGGPRVVYVNPAFTRMTGFTPADILGRTPRLLQHRDTDPAELTRVRTALRKWQPVEVELLNQRKDGTPFWVQINITPVANDAGLFTHWVAVQRDITVRKHRDIDLQAELWHGQQALHIAEVRFASAFHDAPTGTAVTTTEVRIVEANHALCALLGLSSPSDLEGLSLFDLVHPDDVADARRACERLRPQARTTEFHTRLRHAAGHDVHTRVTGSLARRVDGLPSHLILHLEDVTDRMALQTQLTTQALHDPLTGLANRRLLTERLTQALSGPGPTNTVVAVLFCDLDRFKSVNDAHGHSGGDEVLLTLAERLTHLVRAGDTAARVGGDEFVVVCPAVSPAQATELAHRIGSALAVPVVVAGGEVAVTVSVGFTTAGGLHDLRDAAQVIDDADTAMYAAKDTGRDRVVLFSESMRARTLDRQATEVALRVAIPAGQLRLHYQPESTLDGAVTGVEALVRWQHPERGLLTPDVFIDIAEDTGLIGDLSDWVLAQACAQQAIWKAGGHRVGPMWVNLSAGQVNDPALPTQVAALLRTHQLIGSDLGVEITESLLMTDLDQAVPVLDALHDMGVRLAIDDFGTGYSSLSYLQRFPVDVVKIDQTFISGLDHRDRQQQSHAIVAAVIDLAHTLGLVVVAEGVETGPQLHRLRRLGCDLAQGYLLSPPRPPAPDGTPPTVTIPQRDRNTTA